MKEQGFKEGDVCGDWEIVKFVAAGGMGEVYQVKGTYGGKLGALKRVRQQDAGRVDFAERFDAEVRILAALQHPYIVALLHAGRHQGSPYFVMEWLDGISLRDFLNQRRFPIALEDALHYATCIALALCAAHEKGILHRDLKPENVFMLESGTLKVVDFGLGKLSEANRASTSERLAGMCTVHYAAPEQLERKPVDDRTDVYALALMFVEMVTLRWAFADRAGVLPARDVARANQILAQPNSLRELLPACPESLASLIDAALRKDKEKRPRSTEFLAALRAERRALRAASRTAAPGIEDEESADDLAPAPHPPEPAHESSSVRVIPQLRTETLPPDQPSPDPTAAGNPAPPPVRTIKMARPQAQIDAALQARAIADASARAAETHCQPGDSTGAGRSATLPPEPSSLSATSATTAPTPLLTAMSTRIQPMPQSQDDTAARASLEFANRPTQPWKPAASVQTGTSSLTPTHSGLPLVEVPRRQSRLPLWMAPALGMVLTLAAFLVIKVVGAGARHERPQVHATAASASASGAPTASPTAASSASASGAPTGSPTSTPSATVGPAASAAETPTTMTIPSAATASTLTPAPSAKVAAIGTPTPTGIAARPPASKRPARAPTPEPVEPPKPEPPKPATNRLFGAEQ